MYKKESLFKLVNVSADKRICAAFMDNKCSYGKECKFYHPSRSERVCTRKDCSGSNCEFFHSKKDWKPKIEKKEELKGDLVGEMALLGFSASLDVLGINASISTPVLTIQPGVAPPTQEKVIIPIQKKEEKKFEPEVATHQAIYDQSHINALYNSVYPIFLDPMCTQFIQHATLMQDGVYTITHTLPLDIENDTKYYLRAFVKKVDGVDHYQPEGVDTQTKELKVFELPLRKATVCGEHFKLGNLLRFIVPKELAQCKRTPGFTKGSGTNIIMPLTYPKQRFSPGKVVTPTVSDIRAEKGMCGAPWVVGGYIVGLHIGGEKDGDRSHCVSPLGYSPNGPPPQ